MPNHRNGAAAADRLLTPLGGFVFSVVLTIAVFWIPMLSLVE